MMLSDSGTQVFYKDAMRHRDILPAVINGAHLYWYINDVLYKTHERLLIDPEKIISRIKQD